MAVNDFASILNISELSGVLLQVEAKFRFSSAASIGFVQHWENLSVYQSHYNNKGCFYVTDGYLPDCACLHIYLFIYLHITFFFVVLYLPIAGQ